MPESYINLTEGSGKKAHTWQRTIGANTVEDEYVLNGEPALSSYIIQTGLAVLSTANAHLLQIMAGASLRVRIRRIEMWQQNVVTAGTLFDTNLIRLTTAGTGGTAYTPQPLDPADGASGCTAMVIPTAKGTEGSLIARTWPYMIQTLGASTYTANPVLVWDFDRPRSKPLIIAAGATNGVCIKNGSSSAAGAVAFTVWVDESSF